MDYYSILGVNRNATGDDIKKAFKKKAMKYHPDRNPGNKESEVKFKEAKEAYDTLSDPQKKSMYDQFGTTDFNTGGQPGGGFHHAGGFGDVFEDIWDVSERFLERFCEKMVSDFWVSKKTKTKNGRFWNLENPSLESQRDFSKIFV